MLAHTDQAVVMEKGRIVLAGTSAELTAQPEPLARWCSQNAGQQVLHAWKDLPIRFIGNVSISGVEKTDNCLHVTTVGGMQLVADQVIAAAGLQTPNRLALSAGLA